MAKKSHQRVIKTHWWLLRLLLGGWNSEEKPPTSHKDSLVVVDASIGGWKEVGPTNESKQLVGL